MVAPAQGVEAVSFDIQSTEMTGPSVWRIDLPADPQAARGQLNQRSAFLQQSYLALESAPDKADHLVRTARSTAGGEISFDASKGEALAAPEHEALRLLSILESGHEEVSFGAGATAGDELERSEDRFRLAVERVIHLVSHLAWVETQVEGSLLGRSIVGWSGDMQTLWSEGVTEEVYWMHQRSLSQAMQSRLIQIHALVVTTQSAAKLAVLLTNPAGAILALPVAWKLVEQLLADIEKYQQINP